MHCIFKVVAKDDLPNLSLNPRNVHVFGYLERIPKLMESKRSRVQEHGGKSTQRHKRISIGLFRRAKLTLTLLRDKVTLCE